MSNYSEKIPNTAVENTSWHKILGFVPDGSKVLDVGCSSGKLGEELKKNKGCTVYGTEIDEGDYRRAQKVLDKAYLFNIETDILPAEIAKQKFDVIIFADVIEHLVDPARALKVVKGLLAPAGRIVFSIPNMSHISVRLQLLSGKFEYNEIGLLDKTHLHFYDHTEVTRVIAAAGLRIAETNANMLPYPPSFLRKKLSDLGLKDAGFITSLQDDIYAQTFQFVGYAVAVKSGNTSKPVPLSTRTPEVELTEYIEATANYAKGLSGMLQASEAARLSLEQENAVLKKRMQRSVNNSLPYRAAREIRAKVHPHGKKANK